MSESNGKAVDVEVVEVLAPPSALSEAVKAELRALLEKPLGVVELERVSRIAGQAAKLIRACDPVGEVRRRNNYGNGQIQLMNPIDSDNESLDHPAEALPYESFGAKAIRELVNLLPQFLQRPEPTLPESESIVSLVCAIQHARDASMDDVASKLTERLERRLAEQPKKEQAHEVVHP